jgi:hypothetical protein
MIATGEKTDAKGHINERATIFTGISGRRRPHRQKRIMKHRENKLYFRIGTIKYS